MRHFLPYGVVRYSQVWSELSRLGIPRSAACRLALAQSVPTRISRSHLDLLPSNALKGIQGVIDVGANVGEWTADLLSICTPAQVLCIEPDPKLAAGLRLRFQERTDVLIEEAAIGDVSRVAELRVMHSSVLNSFRLPSDSMAALFPEPFRVEGAVRVKLRTLDSIAPVDLRISLLKIDVQGFEREVLVGAEETLKRTDVVILEVNLQPHYEGEAGFFELDSIMQRNGFCIGNYSEPKGGRRQALFADVIYVRKDS